MLHDVGKMGLPDAVLLKPGPLDREEWALMRCHPRWGAELIATAPGCEMVAEVVLTHHERFDGRGYPDGIAGEAIPLEARIIFVADAFEAMTSDRPYRQARTPGEAVEELRRYSGVQFDPAIVEVLASMVAARDGGHLAPPIATEARR